MASKPRKQVSLKLIALAAIFVILAIIPIFVESPYELSLIISVGMYSILAMTFILILRTGLITLGVAAFWGVGAYTSAMMVTKAGMSFWIALPASAIITGIFALIVGLLFCRTGGFSFVIMTMLINLLFVVAVGSTKWLGGYQGIVGIPAPDPINLPFLPPITFASSHTQYYLLLLILIIVVVILSSVYASSIGRAWNAIGLNDQLASTLGINVFKYRVMAFVLASTLVGLVGSFYAHFVGVIRPEAFNIFKTIYVHIYAILGSVLHAFLGPAVGSAVLVYFPELISKTREIEPIITGLLLILLMIFLPAGLLSLPVVRAFATDPRGAMGKAVKAIKSLPSRRGAR